MTVLQGSYRTLGWNSGTLELVAQWFWEAAVHVVVDMAVAVLVLALALVQVLSVVLMA